LHIFSLVAGLIRGRILLDGDANKVARVPDDSVLIIRLQDVSLIDAPAIEIARTRMFNLYAFPFGYEIQVPTEKMASDRSYALSARLTKGDTLLFTNDQHIAVPATPDSPLQIDIPVIDVNPSEILSIDSKK
jgi:putative lipoprotein